MNETTVTVVGNIATDVTSKRVGSEDHLLVTFRVASSARRWDRATESWTDGERFSALVSCWRRLGEGVVTSLVKGDPVVVTGRLSVRDYEVNGERRYSTEIAAHSVGPDLARSSAHVSRRRPGSHEGPESTGGTEGLEGGHGVVAIESSEAAGPSRTAPAAVSAAAPTDGAVPVMVGLHGAPPVDADDDLAALAVTA